jgi:hypothetical protein
LREVFANSPKLAETTALATGVCKAALKLFARNPRLAFEEACRLL